MLAPIDRKSNDNTRTVRFIESIWASSRGLWTSHPALLRSQEYYRSKRVETFGVLCRLGFGLDSDGEGLGRELIAIELGPLLVGDQQKRHTTGMGFVGSSHRIVHG